MFNKYKNNGVLTWNVSNVFSAVNKEGDLAPRVGFVHNFKMSEMVVRRWDSVSEDISTEGKLCFFYDRGMAE